MRLWGRTRDQMQGDAREVLLAEPPQTEAMGVVLNAWEDLSTERPLGPTDEQIPWSKVMRWCDRHGLDAREARIVWHVIRRQDIEELERRSWEAKQQAASRPAPPGAR